MVNDVNKVNLFVIAFITLIVGIVLLSETSDQVNLATEQNAYTASNEVITLSNVSAVAVANDWVTAITTVVAQQYDNATGNITIIENTNYTVANLNDDDAATILLIAGQGGSNYHGNTSYINYTYQDDNYVRHATSRVLIRLVTIFFALALLATGIWAMYKMGILDMISG